MLLFAVSGDYCHSSETVQEQCFLWEGVTPFYLHKNAT